MTTFGAICECCDYPFMAKRWRHPFVCKRCTWARVFLEWTQHMRKAS